MRYLEGQPREKILAERPARFTAGEAREALAELLQILEESRCGGCWLERVSERFEFIPSSDDPEQADVLFTGYFQPLLDASPVATPEYRFPLYRRPPDLITAELVTATPEVAVERVTGRVEGESFLPYYSRREIEESDRLRGHEIAWVKDPVDLFFLHVQGSGVLRFADGRRLHVSYAASNGRPYRSIGRLLADAGRIPREEMSMQRLRRYLAEHPEEQRDIMAHNESYVFFRAVEDGPLGSLDFPLTPGRSIATDGRLFPKGALAFIATDVPVVDAAGELKGWRPTTRFVLNQDTGSAIRGPRRADLYFGTGETAGAAAGLMNRPGRLYFLKLKQPGRR
ncbi:MAG TPA: MltA domain-containing protein [candidate division Zixibacteria bacterium]|nr:MltA domain-containing protein [candidate division Zixibacteria bacterium]